MSCQSGTSYIVQSGDTLYIIAERTLGDGNRWHEIKNPDGTSPDPNQLQPGQELCLPGAPSPGFAGIVSRETYNALFPNRNGVYTYDGLIAASQQYPRFCTEGSLEDCKREAAAFLANISHETGELVYVEEQNPQSDYCDPSNTTYPCVPGKSYHGRGPIQLSWNYNYGACGDAIGRDLLHQPELVSADSAITFLTALWFWMTPQAPKTSCHEAVRVSGFGMTIDIINGGIECGKGAPTPQALHRIELYQRYAATLQVTPGQNLYC
jgi:predicted chitinase